MYHFSQGKVVALIEQFSLLSLIPIAGWLISYVT